MRLILHEGKQAEHPRWILPSYTEEQNEFMRYGFSANEITDIKNSFISRNIIPLDNSVWKKLRNTDSWDVDMSSAIDLSKEYGKDYERIIKAYEAGKALPCPIIVKRGGDYELIAGNTRLMFAKALNIKPKVLMIKLKGE